MILIAEIGNNFFGDIKTAQNLIEAAIKSGADLIKGQAFKPEAITTGSMPKEFYKQCALTEGDYIYLIDFARAAGKDMFFSIFGDGFDRLRAYQKFHKISGGQVKEYSYPKGLDLPNTFVSAPFPHIPDFINANILYVSEYLVKDPHLFNIWRLEERYKRSIGYSDHTIGINNCLEARQKYGSLIIEKHFKLMSQGTTWRGMQFRDLVHAANQYEFKELSKGLRK